MSDQQQDQSPLLRQAGPGCKYCRREVTLTVQDKRAHGVLVVYTCPVHGTLAGPQDTVTLFKSIGRL